jgi:hypothetical protein
LSASIQASLVLSWIIAFVLFDISADCYLLTRLHLIKIGVGKSLIKSIRLGACGAQIESIFKSRGGRLSWIKIILCLSLRAAFLDIKTYN